MQLAHDEIAKALSRDSSIPAILKTPEAARLLRVSKKTLYEWLAQGLLSGTYVKRGKHLFFWRDKLIEAFFADVS